MEKRRQRTHRKPVQPQQKPNYMANIIFIVLVLGVFSFFYYFFGVKSETDLEASSSLKKTTKSQAKTKTFKKPPDYPFMAAHVPFKDYRFRYTYNILVKGFVDEVDFKMYVPISENNKSSVTISSVSKKPDKFYRSYVGYVAEYNFKNLEDETIKIVFDGKLKTRVYDMKLAKQINKNLTPEKDLSPYLKAQPFIEVDDPYIKKVAKGISGLSQEEIVNNIFWYLQRNIEYVMIADSGAKKALMEKRGKCTEFAAAMVALCRARNIPARIIAGDVLRSVDTPHVWVEVYYDEYGWVMYDPTTFSGSISYKEGNAVTTIGTGNPVNIQNEYIVLRRNEVEDRAIEYSYKEGQNAKVSFSRKFQVKEIK